MFGAPPKELPQKIAFLLVPNFSMIAFTSAVEPLRLANRASGRELYSWHLFSPDGKPVTASNGIAVTPEGRVDDAGGIGTVVLCSGIDGHRYEDRNVFAQLRKFDRKGADVGALCTGSHILARAGLLDGYRCTIHWENLAGFAESFLFNRSDSERTGSSETRRIFSLLYLSARFDANAVASVDFPAPPLPPKKCRTCASLITVGLP